MTQKTNNPIKHETMPLRTLMRATTGTVGQYSGDVRDSNKITARITSYATHAGAKLQTERYSCINQRTGKTMVVIEAKITKRGRPLQRVGRKPLNQSVPG